jgi:microsomal dipeptidase-like Zn-dependent dipeptidase
VIADLHCHYPMHVMMDDPKARLEHAMRVRGRPFGDKLRALVLRIASALFSDRSHWSGERVNVEFLQQGNARLVFSVLHSPFSEYDLGEKYGSPPLSGYFADLLEQIDQVESELETHGDSVITVVNDTAKLDAALAGGAIAVVHCLEGGVDLGPSEQEIRDNVATLKERGVVYITLAHLFYRQVATNTPAIPFLRDSVYNWIFRQPKGGGLTDRGRVAVEAMIDNGIVVDLAHMRGDAIAEAFQILDEKAPGMPVINSHAGYRCGKQEYMLDDATIERIAARRGVIGLILAQHQLNDGIRKKETKTFDESFEVIKKHVDKIRKVVGSHECTGIGTDFDGFIKPTMGGLETMADLTRLESALKAEYGAADAERMTFGNAERVLRQLWQG